MNNTKGSITSNIFWRFAERSGAQLVTFIVQIVLARLLDPEAYGTVALITVFTMILQVFVDSGLGNALIRKKDADDLDFSTVFYTNIVFCLLLYLLIFFCAPFIAGFYDDLSMTPYIRVLGLTVLISGMKNVQQAYVSRHMMFRKFFFVTLGGTITAGVVGVIMAFQGFGIWALVAQHVANVLISTILLWTIVNWRPIKKFSFDRLKDLFGYGWKLLASSLLDTVYRELRQLIIGKYYSSSDLGYYNQGNKIPTLITSNINSSIDSVLLPVMANVQEDRDHLRKMTRRSISMSVYIMAPFMIGLAFVAESLIKLLLTDKWLPAVPYLRVFCITYMFYPIHTANLNAIKAMGRSDIFLWLEILKKIVGLVAMFVTMRISVMAMAYSLLVTNFLGQVINSWPNRKLLNYGYLNQLKDILPSILLAAVMGCCVHLFDFFNLPKIALLIVQIISGAVIYIAGSKLLKFESFFYLWDIVNTYISKVKRNRNNNL